MMISPESYAEKHMKNKRLSSLIKERNRIIEAIQYYENPPKQEVSEDISNIEFMEPGPDTHYKWNNHYLIVITNMILEKIQPKW